MKTRLFPLISGIILLLSSHAMAQIATGQLGGAELNAIQTAVPFLTIAPDSRAGAMGDGGVATSADVNLSLIHI